MDPVANINQQRELAAEIQGIIDRPLGNEPEEHADSWRAYDEAKADRNELVVNLAAELAELVQALDEWRRNGGFDPYRATS